MKITFKEINCFIPEWDKNKKQPESEQIKIYWRYPNSQEVKAIRHTTNPRMEMDAETKKDVKSMYVEMKIDYIAAVEMLVERIENLEVNGKAIENGKALIQTPGLNGLFQEVSAEILFEMDKIKANSKNS